MQPIEKMKIVYIAHPIGGDVEGNLAKIIEIVKGLNRYPNLVPFAHYYVDCTALDDNDPLQRAKGIANDMAIIDRLEFDACLLYGDKVSSGMLNEVGQFNRKGIQVIPMTPGATRDLHKLQLLYCDPIAAWRNLIYPYLEIAPGSNKPTRITTSAPLPYAIRDKIARDIDKFEARKNQK